VDADPGDVHPATLEMDEKQHVVGHQPSQREHLRGEEVRPRQQRQVGPNEGRPGSCAPALRCGRQTMALQDIADRLIANLIPVAWRRCPNASRDSALWRHRRHTHPIRFASPLCTDMIFGKDTVALLES